MKSKKIAICTWALFFLVVYRQKIPQKVTCAKESRKKAVFWNTLLIFSVHQSSNPKIQSQFSCHKRASVLRSTHEAANVSIGQHSVVYYLFSHVWFMSPSHDGSGSCLRKNVARRTVSVGAHKIGRTRKKRYYSNPILSCRLCYYVFR